MYIFYAILQYTNVLRIGSLQWGHGIKNVNDDNSVYNLNIIAIKSMFPIFAGRMLSFQTASSPENKHT